MKSEQTPLHECVRDVLHRSPVMPWKVTETELMWRAQDKAGNCLEIVLTPDTLSVCLANPSDGTEKAKTYDMATQDTDVLRVLMIISTFTWTTGNSGIDDTVSEELINGKGSDLP